jgi:hypothetical protein
MTIDQVTALLNQLGPVLNPLAIDASEEHQSWGIALEDDVNVLVQFDARKDCLVLASEVGAPPAGDRTALYELLLEVNYQWDTTGGLRLSLNGSGGEVFLAYEVPVADLDASRLSTIVISFADTAKAWREIIQGFGSAPAPAPEDLPSMDQIRV